MTDSLLQIQYQQVLLMWSDVQAHLPRLYAAAKGIVVELGVRAGISTTALLAGVEAHQGELWSVDRNCGCGALFHHPQWRFICADSLEAAAFEAAGMPVQVITKKLSEGHPNVLDVINQRMVNSVINTSTGGRAALRDGFYIRRAAAEKRIPCFTSLDTARAAVRALVSGTHTYTVQPLPDYRKKEPQ